MMKKNKLTEKGWMIKYCGNAIPVCFVNNASRFKTREDAREFIRRNFYLRSYKVVKVKIIEK